MWPNPQETADLVTFTEEILNEKLHLLCSVISCLSRNLFGKNSKINYLCFHILINNAVQPEISLNKLGKREIVDTQPALSYSKWTKETLEEGVEYVQS